MVYADMVGYSRLIELDDIGTLERLRSLRTALIDPAIAEYGGKVVQTGGDSLLIVFDSIDGAVRSAVRIQQSVPDHDVGQSPDRAIRFRIGINIADVIADGTDLHGDGVNVAARLQAMCPPGGIRVSRAVRDHVHDRLDLLFDELGALSLKNISRPVEAFTARPRSQTVGPSTPSNGQRPDPVTKELRPPRLSVMVAAFRNQGIAGEHASLGDEIIDDFTTDLSRLPGSFVVGATEAQSSDGQSASPRQLAHELGLAYMIQGAIRVMSDRIRVNVQLIDVESGAHNWAERFDIDRATAQEPRDEVTGRLVRVVYMQLLQDIYRRSRKMPGHNWSAGDLVMHGRALAYRPLAIENERAALGCFEQALVLDPGSIDARIGIADVLISDVLHGWSQSAPQAMVRAEQLLTDVLRRDADISEAHTYMGMLRRLQGRLREARIELEIAVSLRPNNTLAIGQLGITLAFLGHPEQAIPLIERCLRLAPQDGIAAAIHADLGLCHLLVGRSEAAIICLRRAEAGNPRLYYIHLLLAAVLGLRGDLDRAGGALRQAIEIRSDINSISSLLALPWHTDRKFIVLFEKTIGPGLQRAGLPNN